VDLNASLRAAAADPPPTRIDLDALIRAEQRRGYRQRRLFGAGVVSGVAVLVGAASVGWPLSTRAPMGGGGPVCPWVSPSVDPSFGTRPPMASASPVPRPSGSVSFVAPSAGTSNVSPPPSVAGTSDSPSAPGTGDSPSAPGTGDSPSAPGTSDSPSAPGTGDSPNVEASGSPAGPPPETVDSPLPSGPAASWPGPDLSASAGDLSAAPDRSRAEVCGDTIRRLEHVLTDALARIAPDAHPATPIRFYPYPDGTVRAIVVFSGGRQLGVSLLPLWADSYDRFKIYFLPESGTSYDIGDPARGIITADPGAGPLTEAQIRALANEPGLTLTG
jgi:hypothetical protein